jgi:hypothetical protein
LGGEMQKRGMRRTADILRWPQNSARFSQKFWPHT